MKNLILLFALICAPIFSEAGTVKIQNISTQGVDKYYSYNFGTVRVNFAHSVDFTLRADGPDATQIQNIQILGSMFDARTNCPRLLLPGQTCVTRVTFWPFRDGFYSGRLIYFLGDTSHIVIDLSGWGQP